MGATSDPGKSEWRARILAARRSRGSDDRIDAARRLADHAARLAAPGSTICAYVPVGTEPGSVPEDAPAGSPAPTALLDALRHAGARVLLPLASPDSPLGWAEYVDPSSLAPARYGLLEPTTPDLGHDAVARAALVLVPALAADRRGVRLGRGAGHYDRSLTRGDAGTPRVVVVFDDEVVERLPADPHDVPMTAILTPRAGLRAVTPA